MHFGGCTECKNTDGTSNLKHYILVPYVRYMYLWHSPLQKFAQVGYLYYQRYNATVTMTSRQIVCNCLPWRAKYTYFPGETKYMRALGADGRTGGWACVT